MLEMRSRFIVLQVRNSSQIVYCCNHKRSHSLHSIIRFRDLSLVIVTKLLTLIDTLLGPPTLDPNRRPPSGVPEPTPASPRDRPQTTVFCFAARKCFAHQTHAKIHSSEAPNTKESEHSRYVFCMHAVSDRAERCIFSVQHPSLDCCAKGCVCASSSDVVGLSLPHV